MSYAQGTSVPTFRSRNELEVLLKRHGAEGFGYAWKDKDVAIQFQFKGRLILYRLPMPDRADEEFTHTKTGLRRSLDSAHRAWEQAERRIWRALLLVVRAKLEAIESGISTFEEEFMAWTALPDGSTVGDWMEPQLQRIEQSGQMPALLANPTREQA